jgi:hypothetical protein
MNYITDAVIANAIKNIDTATQIEAEIAALRKQMIASKIKIQRMLNSIRCDDDVNAQNPVADTGFDLRSAVEDLIIDLQNATTNIDTFDVNNKSARIAVKYDIEITE